MPGAAIAAPAQPNVVVISGDWTQFHNGPSRQGYNSVETTISPSNVGALGVAWTGLTGDWIDSSPAVANGVVYVGSGDGKLYAYAVGCGRGAGSCTPLWTATTGGEINSSPAVANGVVYIGSDNGKLYAFDAAGITNCSGSPKSCAPLWTATTGDEVNSSPAVADGVVYVASLDNKLYAFDAAGITGCSGNPTVCTPLWTGATGNDIFSAPAVAGGVVYVGSLDGKLYAFAVGCASGGGACTPLWTGNTAEAIMSSPAVADGAVYIGTLAGTLYAYAVGCASGGGACTPIWTGTTGEAIVYSTPAIADGVVYIGSNDMMLYAFEVDCNTGGGTCSPLWTGITADTAFPSIYSSPAVANGVVYVGSGDGNLYAFAVGCSSGGGTCAPLWTGPTGGPVRSSPAITDGVVYVAGGIYSLFAFDVAGVVRYSGTSRFATAADISSHTFPANCGCVAYIAYAYNFPDALAGAAAAGTVKGPVLLVNTTGAIDSNTAAELTRLKPTKIIVLGSSGVISDAVAIQLSGYAGAGGGVRYFGAGRFATAAAISANTFDVSEKGGCGCVAYIAYAYNFPDALAGAAAAGTLPGPVLLVNTTGPIDSYTAAELTRLQPAGIVVLGSTGVVSAAVATALGPYAGIGGVVRYSGTSRFATAAAISANTFAVDPFTESCGCVAYIAYAYNFPDALAGAAAAGRVKGPVLLVNTTGAIDSNTVAELTRLKPLKIIVLGSNGVVSDAVLTALKAYTLGGTPH
jgi:outer membrane protein assembly factor BamB